MKNPAVFQTALSRLGHAKGLDVKVAREVLDLLKETQNAKTQEWIQTLDSGPTALYLKAQWYGEEGDWDKAVEHWRKLLSLGLQRDPLVLLDAAKTLLRSKHYGEAAEVLRSALAQQPPYSFFSRAEKLIAEALAHIPPASRTCRIAVLGSSTTNLLIPVLRALCFRDGIAAQFYEGAYGALRQEILDPASRLYDFKPEIVLVYTHWRDLSLPPVSTDESAAVERISQGYCSLWNALVERTQCHVVQTAFDVPPEDAYGYLGSNLRGGRTRVIHLLNKILRESAPAHVSILETEAAMNEVGVSRWADPALWYLAKQHPAPEALPALAEFALAHVRAVKGLARKVLVCDLDNTLWGGVVSEDGLQGIELGPNSAKGEAYLDLQRYLLELKSRGILLAACSKNNREDAELPFRQHPHMLLHLDDFAAFIANWNDKASNLRTLAQQLSLGIDSFVFLDDDPLERAWVRGQFPEVAVVELGSSPFHFVRNLDRGKYFHALTLSTEDQDRSWQYRRGVDREALRSKAQSVEEFLETLAMRASCVPISVENIARVTQLINKTNQFNLTTKRYTQAQVEQLARAPGNWTGVFQLADQFGDYGIVGVIICVAGPDQTWEIDTWLISCRALSRQMENFILDRLLETAAHRDISTVVGIYRPTPKNSLVADLYQRFGFRKLSSADGEQRFELLVAEARTPFCVYIQNVKCI